MNRDASSPRYSQDLDLFHDTPDIVRASADRDAETLASCGMAVEWVEDAGIPKALIRRGPDNLRLDWVHVSRFRFFPVQPDPLFGYCLHPADNASNKVYALASREEVRDLLDALHLHDTYLSLGALLWAAASLDAGLSAEDLLRDANARVSRFTEVDWETGVDLATPTTLAEVKARWAVAAAEAAALFARLPVDSRECLFLAGTSRPVTPSLTDLETGAVTLHRGSPGGSDPPQRG